MANEDAYVVGWQGEIAHFTDSSWTLEAAAIGVGLRAVWADPPEDGIAVGDGGLIMHRSVGGTWTELTPAVTTENVNDVFGLTGGGPAWAVARDEVWKFAAGSWTQMPSPSALAFHSAVWASAVRAGIIASSRGSAIVAPIPRSTVRRDRCFFVTNIRTLLRNQFCTSACAVTVSSSAAGAVLNLKGSLCAIPARIAENR